MSTALALIETTQYEVMAKLAKVAALSGYVGKSEVQAMFIMLKGMELGISPMQALDGIQVINNKTTVAPQLMLALINRSGELEDMQIDDPETIKTNQACKVMMKRKGRSPHVEIFSMADAETMKLAGKDNWLKQPAVMLKWRAVSACARIVFPDVIQGMYTPEEMGAEVSEDASGDIVITAPATPALPNPLNADIETGEIIDPPLTVVDSPKTDEKADLPMAAGETVTQVTTPQNAVQTPLNNGNGKKTIAPKANAPAIGWRNDANTVYKAVRSLYKSADHMRNSIEKLVRDGVITEDMLAGEVIPLIQNHKDETIAPF